MTPPVQVTKTIVVAGGAGLIGSTLIARLLALGHRVLCLDNLQTGSMANLEAFTGNPAFQFRQHDVIRSIRIAGPVDEVYNLACAASPPRYQQDPVHTLRTCTEGSLRLLTLARTKRARILLASSSEVYGDPLTSPQTEDDRGQVTTTGPRACYDEGKRAAETLFWAFGTHHGVATRIARIFNTYGPQMHPDDGRVMSNFIVQALQGETLTIYGDGLQTRSFCHVDDLVEGLMRLMASDETRPVNLGNPDQITIRALADKVIARTQSTSQTAHLPLPQDDPRQRRPDITRAAQVLLWSPKVSLDEGLDGMISVLKARLDG